MTPQMEEQARTSIAIEKKMMACLGREWTGDLHHSVWNLTDDMVAEIDRLRAERDLWQSRCYAALWLVPDEKTCGELQEAARRAKAMLGNGQLGEDK